MSTWTAALVAVAAIGLTYMLCVRPMMRGRGHCGMPAGASHHDSEGAGVTKREIAELREDLRLLRAQTRCADSKPRPPRAETGV